MLASQVQIVEACRCESKGLSVELRMVGERRHKRQLNASNCKCQPPPPLYYNARGARGGASSVTSDHEDIILVRNRICALFLPCLHFCSSLRASR